MSDGPFEVGQRVYWPEEVTYIFGGTDVEGGVVVTTGPAISTMWADVLGDQRMVTRANDRLWTDEQALRENLAKERAEQDERTKEAREKYRAELEQRYRSEIGDEPIEIYADRVFRVDVRPPATAATESKEEREKEVDAWLTESAALQERITAALRPLSEGGPVDPPKPSVKKRRWWK